MKSAGRLEKVLTAGEFAVEDLIVIETGQFQPVLVARATDIVDGQVAEDDMVVEAERIHLALQRLAVLLSDATFDLGVCDANDHVDQIGKRVDEIGQRPDDHFDPLRRAKQSKREQDTSVRQPHVGLVGVSFVDPQVRDPVWDDMGLLVRDIV